MGSNKNYARSRRQLARTIGSEWVFFPDNDDPADPWLAMEVTIVAVVITKATVCLIASCAFPSRSVAPLRRVNYSELW